MRGGGNENENTFIDISGKPFIFVDSIIQFKDDGKNEYPGYNGFTDYNLANSSCIIVRQENNIITTNTFLPKSIQLYAVDEYFLINRVSLSGWQILDMRVSWSGGTTRNYTFGAIMALSTVFMDSTVDSMSSNAQITINYRNSSNETQHRNYVNTNFIKVNYSNATNVYYAYQPQKPDEYPNAVYWNITEVQLARNKNENIERLFFTQLFIMYVPTGYNYI